MKPWQIIRALGGYSPWLFVAAGVGVVGSMYVLPLLPGLILQRFFDDLTDSASVGANRWTFLGLLLGVAVARIFTLLLAAAEPLVHVVVGALLRKNMLRHILHQPGARSVPVSSGEAISRFRDDVNAITLFLSWTFDPIGQVFMLTMAIVILARIDVLLTIGVFVPLLLTVALIVVAEKRIVRFREVNQAAIGAVTGFLGEMFGSVLAIKAADAQGAVVDRFRSVNDARRKATMNDVVFSEFLHNISSNLANLGVGILLVLAADKMRSGEFTVGDLSLFVGYLGGLSTAAGFIGQYMTQWRQVPVSVKRLLEVMSGAPAAALVEHGPVYLRGDFPTLPSTPAIGADRLESLEVEDLTYRYPETGRGISDISFTLPRGSMTVVTGRIGSGKTTLMRALLGLVTPDAGSVRWNGRTVADAASFFVPPRTAYTPQAPRLVSETLRNNILLGIEPADGQLERALHLAVMDDDVPTFSQGLETMVGSRGVRLSGGQMQRSATARMFVRPAEVYVIDDLSSALDVDTERQVWDRLFATEDVTTLVVSHRRPALQRADQIVVMNGGRVEAVGTLDEVLEASAEMRRLWFGEVE